MILKALADYYDRLADDPSVDVPPYGFEDKPIPFLIVLDKQGGFRNIRDTRTGQGKERAARSFRLPLGEKKTSGIKENMLWDNPQYVLGASKSNEARDVEKAENACAAFKKRACKDLAGIDDDGVRALFAFFSGDGVSSVKDHDLFQDIMAENANITFMLDGDSGLIAQRPKVVQRIKELYEIHKGESQVSAISGTNDDVSVLHTAIKGVWGAQTSGANIVSFNDEAYCSHGKTKKDQGLNAPIGKHNEFAYTTALNLLLAKSSHQRMQIGDASTVFWAKNPCDFETGFVSYLNPKKGEEAVSYEKIKGLLSAVKSGIPPTEGEIPFYVLGLAPNASRIAIRFWYSGNVKEIKERVAQHFVDIEMVRGSYDPEFLSMPRIISATTRHSAKHPYGDSGDVIPHLAGEMFDAVIKGTPYPRTLLQKIVNRVKAEQALSDSKGKRLENVTFARAALIKGFLVRASRLNNTQQKEVSVALDRTYDNIGYVLGRLFAVLERIQEVAQGKGLNKTIRDTYFSGAVSSPQVVFKRIQDLSIHHLAKIKNSGRSTVWLEKELGEIMDLMPKEGPPTTLSLEDQGRSAVGYYHQRQDFFRKKETTEDKGDE